MNYSQFAPDIIKIRKKAGRQVVDVQDKTADSEENDASLAIEVAQHEVTEDVDTLVGSGSI